jgi:hypothetical protein
VGYVARNSGKINAYEISVEILKDHFGDTGIDRGIFKWLVKKIKCKYVDRIQLTQDKGHFVFLLRRVSTYVFVVRCFEFTQGT